MCEERRWAMKTLNNVLLLCGIVSVLGCSILSPNDPSPYIVKSGERDGYPLVAYSSDSQKCKSGVAPYGYVEVVNRTTAPGEIKFDGKPFAMENCGGSPVMRVAPNSVLVFARLGGGSPLIVGFCKEGRCVEKSAVVTNPPLYLDLNNYIMLHRDFVPVARVFLRR